MAPRFYITDTSPFGARVRLVAALTGFALEDVVPASGSGSPEMQAVSPFGKLPVIETEGKTLVESLALMEYVVEKSGDASLLPGGAETRAGVRGLILSHDNYVLKAAWPMFMQLRTGKPDPTICRAALDATDTEFAKLTDMFEEGDFACAGRLTLADLAMAPFGVIFGLFYPVFGSVSPLTTTARLTSWWAAVRGVPEVATVLARMEAGYARALGKK